MEQEYIVYFNKDKWIWRIYDEMYNFPAKWLKEWKLPLPEWLIGREIIFEETMSIKDIKEKYPDICSLKD